MRKSWGSTSTPYQYFNLLSSSPKMNIDCFFQKSQVVNSLEYKLKKKKKRLTMKRKRPIPLGLTGSRPQFGSWLTFWEPLEVFSHEGKTNTNNNL